MSEPLFVLPPGWVPAETFELSWHPELGSISRSRVYDEFGNPLPWEYHDDPRDAECE